MYLYVYTHNDNSNDNDNNNNGLDDALGTPRANKRSRPTSDSLGASPARRTCACRIYGFWAQRVVLSTTIYIGISSPAYHFAWKPD